MSVTLREMIARLRAEDVLENGPPESATDVEIRGLTDDSRAVREGWLFCAVPGTQLDGHDFLGQVAKAGAAAALVETPRDDLPIPQVRVRDGRRGASLAAAVFYGDPWQGLRTVAVTGTNGKTTTVAMLHHLLGLIGPTGSVGTLGAIGPDGDTLPGSEGLTTPGPVEVARWFAALRDRGTTAVAMETSSHALHQGRVAAIGFDVAVFTNLSRDHLDYHGGMDEYRAAKLRLIDQIKDDGTVVLNADDPAWSGVAGGARTVTYGMGRDAEIRATDLDEKPRGISFRLHFPDGAFDAHIPLIGRFNVSNAVGAAAATWTLGVPAADVSTRLATLPQTPGRLERVAAPRELGTILIDFAHTPDALRNALAALRPITRGRLIVLFGAGGDRDMGKRAPMGAAAAELADFCILTSDNPRSEDPRSIADEVEAGMGDAPHERILDRREAIRFALETSGPDDVVLLAGKGHERYQEVQGVRHPFDEREVVAELLAERASER